MNYTAVISSCCQYLGAFVDGEPEYVRVILPGHVTAMGKEVLPAAVVFTPTKT